MSKDAIDDLMEKGEKSECVASIVTGGAWKCAGPWQIYYCCGNYFLCAYKCKWTIWGGHGDWWGNTLNFTPYKIFL